MTSPTSEDGAAHASLEDGQEGFICPQCHQTFFSPGDLQSHFEATHVSEAGLNAAKRSEGHFHDLKDEVNDLQTTLKQEVKYSADLKRQVEQLVNRSSSNAAAANGDEEKAMMKDQVHALEEGKRLRKPI